MRRRVYPRRIEAGKMTQTKADREILLMEDILAKLTKEKLDGELAL